MIKKMIWTVVVLMLCAATFTFAGQAGREPDEITLEYWTHTAPTLIEVNNELIEKFEAENPGINIVYTPAGSSGDLYNKLVTSFAGGVAPDVFWLPDWWLPRFAELGMADEVPDFLGDIESLYEPGALEGYEWNGKLYTAGISEYNTLSILYNKEVFDDAGVAYPSDSVPMTLEELIAVAEELTTYENGSRQRSGFEFLRVPLAPANWVALIWEPLLRQQGVEFIDPATGKPDFTSDEVVDLFTVMQDMEQKHRITDTSFVINMFDDFANGRIGMLIGGAWAPPIIRSLNPDAEIGVTPFPVIDGGNRATPLYSWGWVVNPNSRHAEAAWEFAHFLATEHADVWWEKAGYIQPLLGRFEKLAEKDPIMQTFIDDFNYGQYTFRSPEFTEITSILGQVQSSVMSGDVDVKNALENAMREVLRILE